MTLIQQQRLLGVVLLVCLIGVIAWQLLATVEENQPAKPQQEPIAFDSVIEPIPDDIELVEPLDEVLVDPHALNTDKKDEASSAQVSTIADAQVEPDTAPAPAPAPAPVASDLKQPQWVLQVASFTDRDKANALLTQVKKMGYDPMIETAVTSGKQYYRVRLKPTNDRRYLERASGELDKALRVSTQILTYQP